MFRTFRACLAFRTFRTGTMFRNNAGLGTLVPWDEKFVIEPLSDSTLCMAYCTVCHILQANAPGSKPSLSIKPEELTPEVWDHVFLDSARPKDTKIPKEILDNRSEMFSTRRVFSWLRWTWDLKNLCIPRRIFLNDLLGET